MRFETLGPLLGAALLAGCANTVEQLHSEPLTADVPVGRLLYVTLDAASEAAPYAIEELDIGMAAPHWVVHAREPVASPRWAPDGKRFAFVATQHGRAALLLQDLAGGDARLLLSDADAIGAPAWSPDGRQLAFALTRDGNTGVFLLDLPGQTVARLTQEAGAETDPAWSPDGRTLLLSADRGQGPQVQQLNLKRPKPRALMPDADFSSRGASYSPDGHRVVFVKHTEGSDSIEVLDLDSGERASLSDGPADASPVFSPDGKFVAYTSRADAHAIELVSADGRVRQSLKTGSEVREPSWTARRGEAPR